MKNIVSTEVLVLECLAQTKENYGVGIKEWVATKSKGYFKIPDGSLYPTLRILSEGAKIKLIRKEEVFPNSGRPKEYYELTDTGEARVEEIRNIIRGLFEFTLNK